MTNKPDTMVCTRQELSAWLHYQVEVHADESARIAGAMRKARFDCQVEPQSPIHIELQWPDTEERAAHWREVNLLSNQVRELRVQVRKLREDMDGMMAARRTLSPPSTVAKTPAALKSKLPPL